MTSQPRIYADHAASSPLRPEAAEAMREVESALNPAGQYRTGRDARRLLEDAREQIAELLGADPVEVIFTASGTEADNIAVQGLAFGSRKLHPTAGDIIAPGIEHPAVGEAIDWLCTGPLDLGYRRVELPVDEHGVVDLEAAEEIGVLKNMDPEQTALITCMWANNETGNIQPVSELAKIATDKAVPMHVDAVQAVGRVPIDFHGLGVATLAASAHKFGGPRSTGVLLARRDAKILSPLKGGNQERGLRSGTVNVHGAVGTAAALAAAHRDMAAENERLRNIRERVLEAVRGIEGIKVWTHEPSLPSHLHLSIPGAEGDSLIMLLDAAGVDASTGSACAAGVNRASHVLAAMGVDVEVARGALRLTFGAETTMADAERIAELLPRVAEQARAAGMA
ncbi:cysteine desulfurase family protein [Corynebacterium sp. UMB9976]|uniref:cysteine desulfurase family protein n=1 Tax=Corynebacterium sp. UMB9976 TaxID=3046354 RepID=UPI002550EBEE|nr:cysteine desulfurase family protein [Corynebacterium sp. UMB9976]MDK6302180.1 cysteine desulfurase family protein [Corynebacterium sp. UMB9976]